jgi:hypothetical protein
MCMFAQCLKTKTHVDMQWLYLFLYIDSLYLFSMYTARINPEIQKQKQKFPFVLFFYVKFYFLCVC